MNTNYEIDEKFFKDNMNNSYFNNYPFKSFNFLYGILYKKFMCYNL